ncbi:DUF6286 domain-containing protein [Streptomyces sp. NPDC054904]|uniref:DUF6286 domain-containing protein n=1 Tax=Streptomyces sp. Isolate_45 TaxID=2950111 RepID=UPI002481B473|nr:DUF6286 domain-containing protein [Streptomyces sp. Isolate_45]MDA5285816.1 DUF6286 domain-containing protein [Streptomyces sp. Isolate_45]
MSASRRIRSTRRIPAALTALAVIGVAGLFLYDLVQVRAHRPGMRWRPELARWLEIHTPADTEVLVGGGILAAVGALLLVLAVAPGLRGLLVMRTSDTDTGRAEVDADTDTDGDTGARSALRAGLGRKAAAMVLRDRAMEVAGVRSVRVKVGRSRVGVRATSHFRELDDVRADLDEVLAVGIEELGLARPPRPRVRVRR